MATPSTKTMTDKQFADLRKVIYARSGIHFPDTKKYVLESRLTQRLVELELDDFDQYHAFLTTGPYQSDEFQEMFNRITINETSFFRNEPQLDIFEKHVLPELLEARKMTKRLRIWSAACSSGEEPYTLAFTLLDALGSDARSWDVSILATDINTRVLETAANGIYSMERVSTVPRPVLERHFLRGTGKNDGYCRVRANVRALVTFRKLNFMDAAWPMKKPFDLVFCRNALIYFDRKTQENLVRRFMQNLVPEGYLILGHSECVHGWFTDLKNLGNTVYRKTT